MNTTLTSTEALTLLTPNALKEWLESKPAGEPVGEERRCGSCPVAQFFAERGIAVEVGNVWSVSTFRVAGQQAVPLPLWVTQFAAWVDSGDCSLAYPIPQAESTENDYFDPCDADAPHAIPDAEQPGEFGHYVRFRPAAGPTLAALDTMLADWQRYPQDYEGYA